MRVRVYRLMADAHGQPANMFTVQCSISVKLIADSLCRFVFVFVFLSLVRLRQGHRLR